MKPLNIMCAVGTRPEAIKMSPVIKLLQQQTWAKVQVVATAQHRQMLDQVLKLFGLRPHIDLDIMKTDQDLTSLSARLLAGVGSTLDDLNPTVVLAQGDTTTVMAIATACFYRRTRFGHVEAGLRTWDIYNPFPEEFNRVVAGRVARWHFAPTEISRANLLHEGHAADRIHVTGNTVIDALLDVAGKDIPLPFDIPAHKRLVLVTSHRRENFGEPFQRICAALRHLAQRNPDVHFVYPVHPNPNVKEVAHTALSGLPNFLLCEPLDYAPFVAAMKRSHLIMSDSGGVQEEAPALGKPVLVFRDETERPEAVNDGVVKLVGSDFSEIVRETQTLLDDDAAYARMARGVSPYGDGKAAERIVGILKRDLVTQAQ